MTDIEIKQLIANEIKNAKLAVLNAVMDALDDLEITDNDVSAFLAIHNLRGICRSIEFNETTTAEPIDEPAKITINDLCDRIKSLKNITIINDNSNTQYVKRDDVIELIKQYDACKFTDDIYMSQVKLGTQFSRREIIKLGWSLKHTINHVETYVNNDETLAIDFNIQYGTSHCVGLVYGISHN